MGGAKGFAMLYTSEQNIQEAQIMLEPMSYRTTISVECTWSGNKYWEPMLKDTRIRQSPNWIAQLAQSIMTLLEETACVSDDTDEIDQVSAFHILLQEYISKNTG